MNTKENILALNFSDNFPLKYWKTSLSQFCAENISTNSVENKKVEIKTKKVTTRYAEIISEYRLQNYSFNKKLS